MTEVATQRRRARADPRRRARAVRKFPGEYWRKLDRERAYPSEFVAALTEAGFLAALIPEEYGGSGPHHDGRRRDHGGDPRGGLQRRRLPRPDVHDGHAAAARQRRAEGALAAADRARASCGCRRSASPSRPRGTDTLSLRTTAVREGDSLRHQRPEDLDLARRAFRPDAAARAHHAARAGEEAHRRPVGVPRRHAAAQGNGITIRPIRTMMNHATTELFFDDLRVPADESHRRGGQGLPLHPLGMNAERILIAAECIGDAKWFIEQGDGLCQGARGVRPADRAEPGRAVSDRAGLRADACGRADGARGGARSTTPASDCGAEANMAKLLAADASWAAADMCVQTHGGFGFAEEFDVERKFRETRLYQIAPISTNLILSYLAEHVLGLPRSY